jgi:hypothetical protein
MNEKELQNIWNKFTNKFDVSQLGLDYEKFKLKMDTTDKRKRFFDKYSQSLGLGDYENFEKNISQLSPQPDQSPQLSKPSQTIDPSVFNCIKNSGGNGKNLQQTIDNPNAYSFVDKTGEEFTFWGNGDFLYIGKNNRSQGKWKCKGSNNFEVITDWGGTKYYYRSETGQWALTPNAPALEENFIKKIVTKHLRSKL